jgi:hypothetical protein
MRRRSRKWLVETAIAMLRIASREVNTAIVNPDGETVVLLGLAEAKVLIDAARILDQYAQRVHGRTAAAPPS